jgi:hypothetical protein
MFRGAFYLTKIFSYDILKLLENIHKAGGEKWPRK